MRVRVASHIGQLPETLQDPWPWLSGPSLSESSCAGPTRQSSELVLPLAPLSSSCPVTVRLQECFSIIKPRALAGLLSR